MSLSMSKTFSAEVKMLLSNLQYIHEYVDYKWNKGLKRVSLEGMKQRSPFLKEEDKVEFIKGPISFYQTQPWLYYCYFMENLRQEIINNYSSLASHAAHLIPIRTNITMNMEEQERKDCQDVC